MLTTIHGLTGDELRARLPRQHRPLATAQLLAGHNAYSLAVFSVDRTEVVLSKEVAEAIAKLSPDSTDKLVAVAGCFTADARAILNSIHAIVLELSDAFWTDESYLKVCEFRLTQTRKKTGKWHSI